MANDLTRKYKPGEDLVLGPEFWQDLFRDLDRRLDTVDSRAQNIDEVLLQARDIALARVNELILPIFEELEYRASVGFLTANSDEGTTIDEGDVISLFINDDNEAKYFKPTEFTALTRRSNYENFAILRTVEWDAAHKIYVGQIIATFGSRGPWNDWQISAVAGSTVAQKEMLTLATAAKVASEAALASVQGLAEQVQNDRQAAQTARAEATAARDVSVLAKNAAVDAKGAAETARDEAVSARTASVSAKDASEQARDTTLGYRNTAQTAAAAAAADRATVATDKGIVAADKATVAADKAAVAADRSTVSTDKGIVAADKATVEADKGTTITARDATIAARDTTLGYRDTAQDAATTATTQAATATTKASEASTSAATATTKAGEASASAITATNAKNDAVAARDITVSAKNATLAAVSTYNEVFLGGFATDPTTDIAGNPLVVGAMYYNTTDDQLKCYNGASWIVNVVPLGSEVSSVFGRSGSVGAVSGDYSTEKITAYQAIAGLTGANVHALFQSVASLISAIQTVNNTQQTKLDGIESGATADMTAAEILAAIKTVDGAASGLDAQYVGGADLANLRNAGNMNAGTLPDARLPTRVGTFCKTVTDWNSAIENGWYVGNSASNAPITGWCLGTVVAHNSLYVTQDVYQFSSDSSADSKLYRREMNNGVWGSWYRLRITEAELDARYLGLAATAANSLLLGGQNSAYHLSRANHSGAQAISTVTGLQTALDGKSATGHGHAIADVTGLQTALDGKAASSHSHAWVDITSKPTVFPPDTHGHLMSEITGLVAALAGKADSAHNQEISTITGLPAALDAKAPLASPALTGTPSAPTPGNTVNTTQLATMAALQAVLVALVGNAAATMHLGTFTGTTIPDNQKVKAALQALETALETARAGSATSITANRTAIAGDRLMCDTASSAIAVTLPSAPAEGQHVSVWRNGANAVTIARNGKTIEDVAEDLVLDTDKVGVRLTYLFGTWKAFPEVLA